MKPKELLKRYKSGERNFRGATLEGISLEGCDLREIKLHWRVPAESRTSAEPRSRAPSCAGPICYKADLSGADLTRADVQKANLDGARLWCRSDQVRSAWRPAQRG